MKDAWTDAQLWLDLNREYPPDENRSIPTPEVAGIPMESALPANPKSHTACYGCGLAPAGNDYGGKFSAYCVECQPTMATRTVGANCDECGACGVTFGGLTLFDAHRTGTLSRRRCRTPERMGLAQAPNGVWRTPEGLKTTIERTARLRRTRP